MPRLRLVALLSAALTPLAASTGAGLTSLIDDSDARSVLAERAIRSGRALYGGMTTSNFHDPQPDADNLRADILVYGDDRFWKRIHVGAGTIVTSGQFTGPDVLAKSTAMAFDDETDGFLVAVGLLSDNFAGIAFLPEPGSRLSLGAGARGAGRAPA